jgi:formiminotetrahydrofolate cyclodeaminase|uniref:Cyclodeaminase/cyclohydrolase domain-containing protein n=1 Tax=Desulfobacca acetoxidans TaxID=60893 RepID=A0A7C3V7R1_9BACT
MNAPFLDRLAQARPDPGGGAAAAYSAAVGLALLTKIIRLEKGRRYNDEQQAKFWDEQLAETRRLTRIFQQLRQADVEAYLTMAQALSVRQQGANLQKAVEKATHCPWQIMEQALVVLDLVAAAGARCRHHLISDLLVATELLGGALQGAYHIAAANLPLINGEVRRKEWGARLSQASHQGLEATLRVRSQLLARFHAALNSDRLD